MTSSTPTLRDVAAEAGVSPMTASNALRGKPGVKESTRAKVIAAAKKLNYRINLTASMLKSGRSNIIHVIVNEFDSPFYSKLTQALSNEIVSRGLIPFIEQTQYSPDAAEHALSSNPFSGQLFDGEILHATGLGTNVPLSKLNGGRPFVLLDACEETPTVDAVNFPNEEAERAAMQHLIDRGCRNIAIVGHRFAPRAIWRMPRTRSLCDCAAHAERCRRRLPMTSRWYSKPGCANGIIAGHAIAERILAARSGHGGTEFDGACCANDFAAFGVIRGLVDRGLRVPQDVKVIGFDGVTSGSYTTPALSTIQVDFTQLAKFSVDMLSERIDHGTDEALPPRRAIIGYQLVDRESTAV